MASWVWFLVTRPISSLTPLASFPASLCRHGFWGWDHTPTATAHTDATSTACLIIQGQVFLSLEELCFIVVCLAVLLKITGVCGPVFPVRFLLKVHSSSPFHPIPTPYLTCLGKVICRPLSFCYDCTGEPWGRNCPLLQTWRGRKLVGGTSGREQWGQVVEGPCWLTPPPWPWLALKGM